MRNFIHELIFLPTERLGYQYIRYIVVGGSAFVVDVALLYVFTEYFHWHYLLSATASFIIGAVYNYFLSIAWIFPTRIFQNKKIELLFFIFIGVTGLGLNIFIIHFATAWLDLHYLLSKGVSGILVFSWNFALRRRFLFSVKNISSR